MKPPIIIIDESNYVDFYISIEDAIIGMEPIDVINGLFKAYNSEGYLLKIDVWSEPYSKKRWCVILVYVFITFLLLWGHLFGKKD